MSPRKPRAPATVTPGITNAGNRFQEIQRELQAEDDIAGAPAQAATPAPALEGRTSQQITADVNARSRLSEEYPYKDRQPLEILFAAIARDDVAKTDEYLTKLRISARPQAGWRNINSRDADFSFPHPLLHRAMVAKAYKVAEMMVKLKGADVNARDHDDNTPLHLMALEGNEYGAAFLMDKKIGLGANKNLENGAQQTAFDLLPSQAGMRDGEPRDLWADRTPRVLRVVREDGQEPAHPRSAPVQRR